jgi:hypothetical protein
MSRCRGRHVGAAVKRVLVVATSVFGLVFGALITPARAGAAAATSPVVPPNSSVGGLTYSQWAALQWDWELETPYSNINSSPVLTPNPGTAANPAAVDCTLGQSGSVWFLAGTTFAQGYSTAYRSCTIPAGVDLFFPIIDGWVDNLNCPPAPPGTLTAPQMKQIESSFVESIQPGVTANIDGANVPGLNSGKTAFQVASNGFSYLLPANNALGVLFCNGTPFPAGTTTPSPGAFANGVYLMLSPLSSGVHHISFFAQAGTGSGAVTENVSYTLTVG